MGQAPDQARIEQDAQDCVILSVQPVPVLSHLHSKEVLPVVQKEPPEFQFVPVASSPGAGHHR